MRRIKRAYESIIECVLKDKLSLRFIRGSEQADINAIEMPRVFIIADNVANLAGFEGDAVYNIDLTIMHELAYSETYEEDADEVYNILEQTLLDVNLINEKAIELYPSVNASFSEFHTDLIVEESSATEFENLTTKHIINYKSIIQRLGV
jgi:hypothetical protein